MKGFVGMDEKTRVVVVFFFFFFYHTIFSLVLPGLDNQDLIKDYCYDYIEIFMTI